MLIKKDWRRTRRAVRKDESAEDIIQSMRDEWIQGSRNAIAKEVENTAEELRRLKEVIIQQQADQSQKIANIVVQKILTQLTVNGAVPIIQDDLSRQITAFQSSLEQAIMSAISSGGGSAVNTETAIIDVDATSTAWWGQFDWDDGKIGHFVPKGWHWPEHLPIKTIWDLWFFGDRSTKIRPYSLICRNNDLCKKDRHHGHLRCKAVMKLLLDVIENTPDIEFPPGVTSVGKLSLVASDAMFDAAFSIVMKRLYTDRNKKFLHRDTITPGTLYNIMCQARKETVINTTLAPSPVAATPVPSPVTAAPVPSPVTATPIPSPVTATPIPSPVTATSAPVMRGTRKRTRRDGRN